MTEPALKVVCITGWCRNGSTIMGNVLNEKERLETQVEKLLAERETIRTKVEAMLDAVAALDPEMAEELR